MGESARREERVAEQARVELVEDLHPDKRVEDDRLAVRRLHFARRARQAHARARPRAAQVACY